MHKFQFYTILKTLGWPLFECDGYEADDILGTLSEQANTQGIESCLITSDLDMLQLIDNDTKVFAMKKGFLNIEEFDLEYFEEKIWFETIAIFRFESASRWFERQHSWRRRIYSKPPRRFKNSSRLKEFTKNLEKIKPAVRKSSVPVAKSFYEQKTRRNLARRHIQLDLNAADIHQLFSRFNALKKLEFNPLVRKSDHVDPLHQVAIEFLMNTEGVIDPLAAWSGPAESRRYP